MFSIKRALMGQALLGEALTIAGNDEDKAKALKEHEDKCWAVFVTYHSNSPWARAKASLGGPLSREAVQYMQQEIDRRAEREAEYQKWAKGLNDEEPKALSPGAVAGGHAEPASVRGTEGDTAEAVGLVQSPERDPDAGAAG